MPKTLGASKLRGGSKLTKANALAGIKTGTRVQLHPATDAWMQGDRYGTIVKVGRKLISVKMDKSGRTLKQPLQNLHLEGYSSV
jgi:hypothetical protein